MDQSVTKTAPTVDDEISDNLAKIEKAPISKLAGMKDKKNEKKESVKVA